MKMKKKNKKKNIIYKPGDIVITLDGFIYKILHEHPTPNNPFRPRPPTVEDNGNNLVNCYYVEIIGPDRDGWDWGNFFMPSSEISRLATKKEIFLHCL